VDYEELEAYYSQITEVRSTASFSSLLFYRKQSLRNGGFFMRSPLQDNVNRFDLMYAVLADIACATYEQLRFLINISGNDPDYIIGCGGGFQSETLCRMIASLCGKSVVLKKGYRQATIQGLVAICNRTFEISADQEAEYTTYEPDPANLVLAYYPVWSENRNRANIYI
jgi:autoinducer 2 (AI-2) kinase